MDSTDDKPLHDWVRRSLDDYQPAYQPNDWFLLRRKIRRRRWRIGLLVSCLLLLISGGYVVTRTMSESVSTTRNPSRPVRQLGTLATVCSPSRGNHIKLKLTYPKQQLASALRTNTPSMPPTPAALMEAVIRAERPVSTVQPQMTTQVRPIQRIVLPVPQWPLVAFRTLSPFELAIEKKLLSGDIGSDSTVFAALTRNLRRWPNSVIVCDLTTSMDPFAAQVYAWFRHNTKSPQIQGTVFYTDCDSLGQETRPGGPAGMFFVTRERDPRRALPTLLAAARNTLNNKLSAENVVEALQFAHREFPKAQHLILIADNGSSVKGMDLLSSLNVPVHVISCDTQSGNAYPFEPDQFRIAQQTNGSLHTLDDDIEPGQLTNNTFVRSGSTYYKYVARKGRFVKTNFQRRPVRIFGINL